MIKVALAGIVCVMLAINLKSVKSEYNLYIGLAASIIIAGYGLSKMKEILEMVETISGYISSGREYIGILIKIAGITYIAEIASGICKDAGHSAVASQIEFVARLTILSVSIPVMTGLIGLIEGV